MPCGRVGRNGPTAATARGTAGNAIKLIRSVPRELVRGVCVCVRAMADQAAAEPTKAQIQEFFKKARGRLENKVDKCAYVCMCTRLCVGGAH
jgi:hypothetical protein